MKLLTASEAIACLDCLIDQVSQTHEHVFISGNQNNALLISEESWRAIQETLHLLASPRMRQSIKDEMAKPLSKSKSVLKW